MNITRVSFHCWTLNERVLRGWEREQQVEIQISDLVPSRQAANIPCLLTYPARSLGVLDNVRRMWAACKNIYLTDHSLAGAAKVVHLLFSLSTEDEQIISGIITTDHNLSKTEILTSSQTFTYLDFQLQLAGCRKHLAWKEFNEWTL